MKILRQNFSCKQVKKQRWSRGRKARGQGQGHKNNPRPRPRTAFPRTDTLEAKDRNAQGQGPRTQSASALQKKKKRSSQKFFKRSPRKKRFPKNFSTAPQNFNFPKNSGVLEPRTGQFWRTLGLKAKDLTFEAKAKDFKICPRGRPRGQGRPRGLHLCQKSLVYCNNLFLILLLGLSCWVFFGIIAL